MPKPMAYEAETQGVVIRVRPNFLDEESSPAENRYFWAYHVEIENRGKRTLQLMTRHWHITDREGRVQEVNGSGVVGQKPVLKPGGRFMCLEFSRVDMPFLDKFYDAYSFAVIPAVGKVVTGDGQPYRYLVESIRTFPDQEKFKAMITAAGFARASYRNLSGGIVAIHSGWRI